MLAKNSVQEKRDIPIFSGEQMGAGRTDWHGKDLLSALLAVEQVSLPLELCQI